jgi:hypothetical protein
LTHALMVAYCYLAILVSRVRCGGPLLDRRRFSRFSLTF